MVSFSRAGSRKRPNAITLIHQVPVIEHGHKAEERTFSVPQSSVFPSTSPRVIPCITKKLVPFIRAAALCALFYGLPPIMHIPRDEITNSFLQRR